MQGQAWLLLGLIARDQRKLDEALSCFDHAVHSHQALLDEFRDEPQIQGHLAEAWVEGFGKTYRQMERTADALASYRKAAKLLTAPEHKDPTDLYNLRAAWPSAPRSAIAAMIPRRPRQPRTTPSVPSRRFAKRSMPAHALTPKLATKRISIRCGLEETSNF